ncbi:putative ATP-dependent RNA helicase DDX4 isoform X2 [Maylandia zebra]|uniref:RNA helicase n=1 Tax=Maylandia zebra TaxID=106582 RepID=A0A3P9CU78_9CICH|nr:probable ATP-dependent RNA helicase DDX4 [Maylandia zebra]XP_004564156.1 probable ATP-dependent RNA helicase DDX4 [Maylandia zebra]XP_004564157.1 probable ATP-dependent RNA helicase DDX4 [Maylandia zebra]XP_026015180.1 probable ATP-dependent RNA helicase DDX4 isoform X2 [Astatotilapia calliptera]
MDEWEEQETATSGTCALTSHTSNAGTQGDFWSSDRGEFQRGRGGRGRGRGGFKNSSFSGAEDSANDGDSQNNTAERSSFSRRGGRGRGRGFGRTDHGDFDANEENGDHTNVSRGRRGGRGGSYRQGGEQGGRGGFGGGYRGKDEEVFAQGNQDTPAEKTDESDRPRVTYVPPPPSEDEESIFSHYESGVNFDKYDEILVDVSGTNPPPAIMTFDEAALCESLKRNVSKSGYVKPTPVQKHGIPIVSAGRDLMACAQTGSGKTAAFLLPILQQLMADGAAASCFSETQEPEAIIVAPTRELINQIYLEARKFAYGTCVRPVVVYGGVSTGHQIRDLSRGCNVLCGTPGRLLDMIGRGKVGLTKVRYLVLDEADRMLDMGFEPDMRRLVGSPGMPSKENRQTLMFSATFPEDIQRLAADFLKTDYLFLAVGIVGGACSDVEQTFVQVTKFAKRDQLLDLLKSTGSARTMVFVETKRQADFIAVILCQEKFPTTSIHGDREQWQREQALGDFRSGKCPVLVATSVGARGLDIPDVQLVVNFDLPNNIDEYVHRIGRTGRCGNTGRAVSFYDPEANSELAQSLVTILSKAQQEVPSWLEAAAFSGHGPSGFNPPRKHFASTDLRKGPQGGLFQDSSVTSQLAAQTAADDEEWE